MCPRNAPQPAIVLSDPPQDRCQTLVRQDFESLVAICEYDLTGRVLINTVGKRGSLNVRFAPKFVAAK